MAKYRVTWWEKIDEKWMAIVEANSKEEAMKSEAIYYDGEVVDSVGVDGPNDMEAELIEEGQWHQ